MFTALVIYLIVLQYYLVIARQDNTTGLDTMALAAATNKNISLNDTASNQGTPFKFNWNDYVHLETFEFFHFSDFPMTYPIVSSATEKNENMTDFSDSGSKLGNKSIVASEIVGTFFSTSAPDEKLSSRAQAKSRYLSRRNFLYESSAQEGKFVF